MDKILFMPILYSLDNNKMWSVALDNNWKTDRLKMSSKFYGPQISDDDIIAYYGNAFLAKEIANYYDFSFIEPTLDWLSTVPREYLGREIEFMTLAEFPYYDIRKFVKCTDNKWFSAEIFEPYEKLPIDNIDKDLLICVQDVIDFQFEYRCFILNRQLMDISIYPQTHTPHPQTEAIEYISKVLEDEKVVIPASLVIDVGLTDKGQWLIVEANPSFASGMYDCDAQKVFETIIAACIKNADITENEKQWVFRKENYNG